MGRHHQVGLVFYPVSWATDGLREEAVSDCQKRKYRLKRRCVMLKLLPLIVSAMVVGLPGAGLAQFIDKGNHVEVKKGTRLCASIAADGAKGTLNQRPIFWRVTSPMRANGTQTVIALVHDTVYNRSSGDTTTVENPYDDD